MRLCVLKLSMGSAAAARPSKRHRQAGVKVVADCPGGITMSTPALSDARELHTASIRRFQKSKSRASLWGSLMEAHMATATLRACGGPLNRSHVDSLFVGTVV